MPLGIDTNQAGIVGGELLVRQHPPAHALTDRSLELPGRGDVVTRRVEPTPRTPAKIAVLQVVTAVEHQHGRDREILDGRPARQEPSNVVRACHRSVAHHAEPPYRAALHWASIGGDRRHHHAFAQECRRVVLVLAADVETQVGRERSERRQHPRRERVAVDGKRYDRRITAVGMRQLVGQGGDLPSQS